MAAKRAMQMAKVAQNRLRIRGISSKKFDISTSLMVDDHWMLYETRCEISAPDCECAISADLTIEKIATYQGERKTAEEEED